MTLLWGQGVWRPLNTSWTSWWQYVAGMLVVQEARRTRQLPTSLIASAPVLYACSLQLLTSFIHGARQCIAISICLL